MTSRIAMSTLAIVSAAVLAVGARAQPASGKLQITALAVNMSNIGTGGTAPVEFNINRWSPTSTRGMLITTMLDKGADALLSALQKQPSLGKMRFPSLAGPDPTHARLGWDIRYASETPLPDGGRRIVMALDRTIGFWEAANRPRTIDYPFTFIQIQVDKNGEGEGKLSIATKVSFDKKKNAIELETYASEPLRLQGVRVKSVT